MSQWGNHDNAANSTLWGVVQYNKTGNTANKTGFFGNTTPGAYVTGLTVGQFGADTTEMGVSNGSVVTFEVTFAGSGYIANTSVTLTGNATANATANATGRISSVNVVGGGSNYTTSPTVTIDAPAAIVFNGNTAVSANAITLGNNAAFLAVNDVVTFSANATSTPVGLSNGVYYVSFANTTAIKLASTLGGSNLTISSASGTTTTANGASLVGQTATAVATISGVANKGFHAGWVVRKVGSGGRAGRVQYETLVAMGSMQDDSEDTIFKDA